MKTNKILSCLIFVAIFTTSVCWLTRPECQRLKLSDFFSLKNKNIAVVEYNKDGECTPTLAGHQEVANRRFENPNETYFWNYKQCKWITKSEHNQLIDDAFENAFKFH